MVEHLYLYTPTNSTINTRVTNVSGTLIDQLWINNQGRVQNSFVISDTYVSDHLINGISLKERHKIGTTTIKTRKITKEKETAFVNELRATDWSPVLREEDCDKNWTYSPKR